MRTFTVTEHHGQPGLPVVLAPFPHVGVGEEGRGREYARLPLGKRFAEALLVELPAPICACGDPLHAPGEGASGPWCSRNSLNLPQHRHQTGAMRVECASVLRTRQGQLLLVEEQPGDEARALVALRVAPGFRGGVAYHAATSRVEPCPARGKAYGSSGSRCWDCGQASQPPAPGEYAWTHPDAGVVTVYDPLPEQTVLLRGYTAQGDAGRMGGGPELLVVMAPGERAVAHRTGRLYGEPAWLAVDYDGEQVTVRPLAEAEDAEARESDEGELI